MKKYIVLTMMVLGLLGSSFESTSYAAPAKKTAASKKTKKVKKKSSSGGADYSPLNFLPFGVGQFRQGRPLMGGAIGGGQVVMLYLYMDRKKQIDASNSDANATINEINANGGTPDAETSDYLDRNAAYVKKTNQEANLCLLGFLGLYAAGVVDAVWDPLGLNRSGSKKAKTAMEAEEDTAEKWAAERDLEKFQARPRMSLMALPPTLSVTQKTAFGLSFEKRFN